MFFWFSYHRRETQYRLTIIVFDKMIVNIERAINHRPESNGDGSAAEDLRYGVRNSLVPKIHNRSSVELLVYLATIVVVRTAVSRTLTLEAEGRWPWPAPAEDQDGA